jgi:hypothetical protein
LTRSEQDAEVGRGVARIRELTGQPEVPMCYPYGHRHTYNTDTLSAVDAAGYSVAFNTVRRRACPATDSPFEIPRFDTRDLPPFAPEPPHA